MTDLHALNVEAARVMGWREVMESDCFGPSEGEFEVWTNRLQGKFGVDAGGGPWSPTTDANDALSLAEKINPDQIHLGRLKGGWCVTVEIAEDSGPWEFSAQGETIPEALTRALLAVAGREA